MKPVEFTKNLSSAVPEEAGESHTNKDEEPLNWDTKGEGTPREMLGDAINHSEATIGSLKRVADNLPTAGAAANYLATAQDEVNEVADSYRSAERLTQGGSVEGPSSN